MLYALCDTIRDLSSDFACLFVCAILQLVLQIRGGDRDNMGIIVLVLHKNIHFSKYLKEQIIFYHRHYNNIYSDQWPINLTTSGQEFPILLQHFEERSKCETPIFNAIDALLVLMQFSNFLKLRHFSGSL